MTSRSEGICDEWINDFINCCCSLVTKLYPTLCDPMDSSPPGSSVHTQFLVKRLTQNWNSTGSLYIKFLSFLSGLKIRKAFLIQCIYLIDTEVKVPNIIWDVSKTGERKLVFCKLPNFIYHGFIRFFLRASRVPFPGVTSLTLTTSEMILNISSKKHVHPSIRGCRNTVHMSASGVNVALHLTSHFVHSQWKAVYLLNT